MGRGLIRALGLAAACYLGSLLVACVLTVVTAATTERWGGAATEKALLALAAVIGIVFLLSLSLVGFGAWHWLPSWGPRLTVIAGYVVIVIPTLLLGGFLLMVIFNR